MAAKPKPCSIHDESEPINNDENVPSTQNVAQNNANHDAAGDLTSNQESNCETTQTKHYQERVAAIIENHINIYINSSPGAHPVVEVNNGYPQNDDIIGNDNNTSSVLSTHPVHPRQIETSPKSTLCSCATAVTPSEAGTTENPGEPCKEHTTQESSIPLDPVTTSTERESSNASTSQVTPCSVADENGTVVVTKPECPSLIGNMTTEATSTEAYTYKTTPAESQVYTDQATLTPSTPVTVAVTTEKTIEITSEHPTTTEINVETTSLNTTSMTTSTERESSNGCTSQIPLCPADEEVIIIVLKPDCQSPTDSKTTEATSTEAYTDKTRVYTDKTTIIPTTSVTEATIPPFKDNRTVVTTSRPDNQITSSPATQYATSPPSAPSCICSNNTKSVDDKVTETSQNNSNTSKSNQTKVISGTTTSNKSLEIYGAITNTSNEENTKIFTTNVNEVNKINKGWFQVGGANTSSTTNVNEINKINIKWFPVGGANTSSTKVNNRNKWWFYVAAANTSSFNSSISTASSRTSSTSTNTTYHSSVGPTSKTDSTNALITKLKCNSFLKICTCTNCVGSDSDDPNSSVAASFNVFSDAITSLGTDGIGIDTEEVAIKKTQHLNTPRTEYVKIVGLKERQNPEREKANQI